MNSKMEGYVSTMNKMSNVSLDDVDVFEDLASITKTVSEASGAVSNMMAQSLANKLKKATDAVMSARTPRAREIAIAKQNAYIGGLCLITIAVSGDTEGGVSGVTKLVSLIKGFRTKV